LEYSLVCDLIKLNNRQYKSISEFYQKQTNYMINLKNYNLILKKYFDYSLQEMNFKISFANEDECNDQIQNPGSLRIYNSNFCKNVISYQRQYKDFNDFNFRFSQFTLKSQSFYSIHNYFDYTFEELNNVDLNFTKIEKCHSDLAFLIKCFYPERIFDTFFCSYMLRFQRHYKNTKELLYRYNIYVFNGEIVAKLNKNVVE
jgi:hypothetical protein